MKNKTDKPGLKHEMGLLDGTMLVAGSMIGSGIFLVSADIVRNVGSTGWLMVAWLLTGFMTLTAALTYGELSGMFPKAGGQYVYLKEAYNKLIAFLYGWSFFAVIQTGTIAAVGVGFSRFASYLVPALSEDNVLFQLHTGLSGKAGVFTINAAQITAILMILLLTFINSRGIKYGKVIQNTFTLTKLLSLFGLIALGLLALKPEVWHANWSNIWDIHKMTPSGGRTDYTFSAALGAIAAAMIGTVFSSDPWNGATFIAAEMKNARRNVALSLFLGTLIVTFVYVAANVMYTAVLPLSEIASAQHDRVAGAAAYVIFGSWGTLIISILIMISTFGCNNGLILSGARLSYTMAQDGVFFKPAAKLNKFAVPSFGLWIQGIIASVLCLSGKYGDLLDMISFVVVLFYVLTIAGVFILRYKYPDMERPYKAFGYPVIPVIYILMGILFCVLLIIYKPQFTWPGLIIVLLGIPVYFISRRKMIAVS